MLYKINRLIQISGW